MGRSMIKLLGKLNQDGKGLLLLMLIVIKMRDIVYYDVLLKLGFTR
jgi:hypothetical protein